MSAGKRNRGYNFFLKHTHQKHTTGSTDFSSAPNTLGTIEVRSHAAIVRFSPGGGGGGAPDPPRYFSFSFESIPMPEVKEGLIPPQGYFLFDTFCFTSNVPSCWGFCNCCFAGSDFAAVRWQLFCWWPFCYSDDDWCCEGDTAARCDLCRCTNATVHQRLMTTWLLTKTDDDVAVVVQVMMLMQCTNDR